MLQTSLTQVFAHSLASHMKAKGFNQTTLGKAAGVSPNTIANYIKYAQEVTPGGKQRSPGLADVEKIATALGIQALEMLGSGQPMQQQVMERPAGWADFGETEATLAESVYVLGKTFRQVNERVRRAAFSLLEGLCTRPDDASEIAEEVELVIQAGKRRSA